MILPCKRKDFGSEFHWEFEIKRKWRQITALNFTECFKSTGNTTKIINLPRSKAAQSQQNVILTLNCIHVEEEDMKRKKGNLRYLQMKQVLSNMPINITNNKRNHRNISQHITCDAARHVFSYQFSCVSENSSLLKFFSSFVVSI